MDLTETLVATMRTMRLDDPEMYRALMALVSSVVGRREELSSTFSLAEEELVD